MKTMKAIIVDDERLARVNLRKAKVRKHLEYESFNSINSEILNHYADVFNVSVDDLNLLLNQG